MPVRAELDRAGGRRHVDDGTLDALALRIVDRVIFAPDVGDIALLEISDALRDADQRRRIGCEEMVVFPEPDDKRAAGPRADDPARFARGDHGDRIRPLEFGDGQLDRAQQVLLRGAMPMRVDQVRDRLAVGLRAEFIALLLQPLAQGFEIFDDAVMDDGDFTAGQMRMRVHVGRRAVRRPPRM